MRNIDGKTRLCGLIGNPVAHTMSPAIHNTLAEELDHNLVYSAFPVQESLLEDAIKGAWALNALGLNVTVPYKSAVLPYLTEMDPLAEKIGAVNTLVRKETGFKGYNTDMPGLYRAMQEDGVELSGEDVLILGAGGVARAVAMMAATYGAATITVLNRTVEKAEVVCKEVQNAFPKAEIQAMALEDYRKLPGYAYVTIQATNVGMHPDVEGVVIADTDFYQKVKAGYDLVFNPAVTRFMQCVRKAGAPAFNGLKMLLYQGIIAYELWNDCQVPAGAVALAYEKMKEAMGIHE